MPGPQVIEFLDAVYLWRYYETNLHIPWSLTAWHFQGQQSVKHVHVSALAQPSHCPGLRWLAKSLDVFGQAVAIFPQSLHNGPLHSTGSFAHFVLRRIVFTHHAHTRIQLSSQPVNLCHVHKLKLASLVHGCGWKDCKASWTSGGWVSRRSVVVFFLPNSLYHA